jgi:hypothetical protein
VHIWNIMIRGHGIFQACTENPGHGSRWEPEPELLTGRLGLAGRRAASGGCRGHDCQPEKSRAEHATGSLTQWHCQWHSESKCNRGSVT